MFPSVPRFRHISFRFSLAAFAVLAWLQTGQAQLSESVVFVSRSMPRVPDPQQRRGAIERADSGRLLVRLPDDSQRTLVDLGAAGAPSFTPLDVSDPDVSWDGERIVFAGYSLDDGAWRIYEVNADGTGLRQVTSDGVNGRVIDLSGYGAAATRFEGYDDVDPCYLPDGRICFVSTRYPGMAPGGRLRATNLYVVNPDGSDLHRITSERFGADTPAVDPKSGRVVYSRWWLTAQPAPPPSGGPSPDRPPPYYGPVTSTNNFSTMVLRGINNPEFAGVNNWSLAAVNPDGSGLHMFSGFANIRALTMAYRPSFRPNGDALSLFILQSPFIGFPGSHGLRELSPGAAAPRPLGGPQTFFGSSIMQNPNPAVPTPRSGSPRFFYGSAEALPDGRVLVTGHPAANRNAVPDFNVYVQTGAQEPTFLFGEQGRLELDAVPLRPRTTPPVIEDVAPRLAHEESPLTVEEAFEKGGSFKFIVDNIFFNAPVDVPVANAPPIGHDLTIEFYMNPQRSGIDVPEPPVLVGTKEIGPDGRIEMVLPAGVPLFEILRRPDGRIALGRDGQAFHVGGMNFGQAGRDARCTGCHAGHSITAVPEDATFTNLAPSAVVTATSSLVNTSFQNIGRFTLSPAVLVDRKTDPVASEWASSTQDDPFNEEGIQTVHLRWRTPIEAKEAVVYGIRPQMEGVNLARTLTIREFELRTSLFGETRQEITVTDSPTADGLHITLDETAEFDALEISIHPDNVSGQYMGLPVIALAEVEVIARGDSGTALTSFIRGDANCDTHVNMSDPVATLTALFRSSTPLCCEAAADVNADGRLNLTDPVYLLDYLYRAGPIVPQPFPECARMPVGDLPCDQEDCLD